MTAVGTYTLVKEMIAHGLSEDAAQDIVNNFVTKDQLKELETKLVKTSEFQEAVNLLRADIASIKSELKIEIANTRADIIKWLSGLIISVAAVMVYFISK